MRATITHFFLLALLSFLPSETPAQAAEPIAVQDLVETRHISTVSISPNDLWAAVEVQAPGMANNRIARQFWVVALHGAAQPRMVAEVGDAFGGPGEFSYDGYAAQWSADSRFIYFMALTPSDGVQVWRAGFGDGAPVRITSDEADIEKFVLDQEQGRILYETGPARTAIAMAEEAAIQSGVLVTDSVQLGERLTLNEMFRGRMATIRRGPSGEFSTIMGPQQPRVRVLDLSTNQARTASAEESERYADLTRMPDRFASPDGLRSALIETLPAPAAASNEDQAPPKRRLAWTPTVGADNTPCLYPQCLLKFGVESVSWEDSAKIIFVNLDGNGASSLYEWDIETNRLRALYKYEGLLGAGTGSQRQRVGNCPRTDSEALCVASAAVSPPKLIAVDLLSGVSRNLFDPNQELRTRQFPRATRLTWRDRMGRPVEGVVIRDGKAHTRQPLVITSYNCSGFLEGGNGGDVPELILAQRGFTVLCVDYDFRSYYSPPQGVSQLEGGLSGIVDGWESGARELAGRGLIDIDRVSVSGTSFGCEGVGYAVSQREFVAVAVSSGAYSPLDPIADYLRGVKGSFWDTRFSASGLLPLTPESWREWARLSPALNARKVSAPILIQDSDTEWIGGYQFLTAMESLEKPIEFYVFPEAGHVKLQPMQRAAVYQRNIDWMRFWLLGQERATPVLDIETIDELQQQYVRWRGYAERRVVRKRNSDNADIERKLN